MWRRVKINDPTRHRAWPAHAAICCSEARLLLPFARASLAATAMHHPGIAPMLVGHRLSLRAPPVICAASTTMTITVIMAQTPKARVVTLPQRQRGRGTQRANWGMAQTLLWTAHPHLLPSSMSTSERAPTPVIRPMVSHLPLRPGHMLCRTHPLGLFTRAPTVEAVQMTLPRQAVKGRWVLRT